MRRHAVIAVVLAVALPACATTRYMGPLPAPADEPPESESKDSFAALSAPVTIIEARSVSDAMEVTPRGAVLKMPDGERVPVPRGARLDLVVANHNAGALEGLIGGALTGAALAAIVVAKNDCAPGNGCVTSAPAAFIATMVVSGLFGALYGAAVGDKTTYRYGPLP